MFGVGEMSTDGDEDVLFATCELTITSLSLVKVGIELELNWGILSVLREGTVSLVRAGILIELAAEEVLLSTTPLIMPVKLLISWVFDASKEIFWTGVTSKVWLYYYCTSFDTYFIALELFMTGIIAVGEVEFEDCKFLFVGLLAKTEHVEFFVKV